jgi:uncharacterized protein
METPDKIFLSWSNIEEYIYAVEKWVLLNKNLMYVTGPARGGLIPAVLLSHKLGIEYITVDNAVFLKPDIRSKILLIDDICDSGQTFIDFQHWNFSTASLLWRNTSKYIPEYYAESIVDNSWIVFPWENKDSETIQDYLKK